MNFLTQSLTFLLGIASFASTTNAQCSTTDQIFQVELKTDNYPDQTSWEVVDITDPGVPVLSRTPGYYTGTNTYGHYDCLNRSNCYQFTIYDSVGDGICCVGGIGKYTVFYDNGIIAEGGEFASFETSIPFGDGCPTPAPAVPPTPSPTPAGGGGDPHFKTFTGVYFSFHGHCDLVLMHSKIMFESESAGLAVHVRTTRVNSPRGVSYSYISGAAVQIGDRVIEVSDDGVLFIDGQHTAFENDEETTSFAGYTLKRSIKGTKGHIVVFDLDLLDGKAIEIRSNTKTRMVFVDIEGHFAGSEGLLGAPMGEDNTGLLSRDGSFDMTGNWNTFGEEWQVLDTEPMLFRERRAPQHPAGCVYESSGKPKNVRRRLVDDAATEVTLAIATEACTKAVGNMKDFCVEDVMATGDLELAEDPFYN